jgi:2-iminobutanoate/2-iminopropanoate deaminase
MQYITTKEAPTPAGHYSQAVAHKGLLYVSGQLPVIPGVKEKKIGTIEEQVSQALTNLKAVIEAAGSSMKNVVKTTVYISDMALWERVDAIYGDFFPGHKPARAIVPTRNLHFAYQIEVEAIAALDETNGKESQ